jgi:hypothetical protein
VGVLAVVVMLAVIHLAVMGSVAASGEEAELGAMRLETARAFFAAESAGVVLVRLSAARQALPSAGAELSLGVSSARMVSMPATGEAGDIVIIGVSGQAQRRVRITLEAP